MKIYLIIGLIVCTTCLVGANNVVTTKGDIKTQRDTNKNNWAIRAWREIKTIPGNEPDKYLKRTTGNVIAAMTATEKAVKDGKIWDSIKVSWEANLEASWYNWANVSKYPSINAMVYEKKILKAKADALITGDTAGLGSLTW